MDRSVDSIGSCSLDVDADSSDISDTSGSLNFPTPLSVKDITREFTANIRERCSVRTVQNSTALVDPATGQVRMVLTQPTTSNSSSGAANESIALPLTPAEAQPDKKPSYLNLACCVNGYSNLTTYDSKIRQDINKSREVSPIRPSSNSLQYCKRNNALAPPVLLTMPNVSVSNGGGSPHTKQPTATGHKYNETNNNNHNIHSNSNSNMTDNTNQCDNGNGSYAVEGGDERRHTSFIQQRVERLYGPGALAQGFYSPKKIRSSQCVDAVNTQMEADNSGTTELSRKFQELSPSKDYSEFRRKLGANGAPALARYTVSSTAIEHSGNNSIDLPVLRHLSQEFRAQLPTISPKRNFTRGSPGRDANANDSVVQNGIDDTKLTDKQPQATPQQDEVDHKALVAPIVQKVSVSAAEIDVSSKDVNTSAIQVSDAVPLPLKNSDSSNSVLQQANATAAAANNGSLEKDGNYFLNLLRSQQTRLLALANDAEKYIEALSNNPDITEDTMGFLRAAAGKARLLVSQKMKQFEGLCHNNLNRSPEDKFPTTVDDLQGFWDMVYLQIDHIDSIFAEIEALKNNDWKRPKNDTSSLPSYSSTTVKTTTTTKTQSKTANTKPKVASTSNGSSGKPAMSAAAMKREAQRKQLLEMKRKQKMALATATAAAAPSVDVVEASTTNGGNSIEMFVDSN